MRTRYSELLNLGALSFLSMSRMVKVVRTVAEEGVRSSFSSVAYRHKYNGVEKRHKWRLTLKVRSNLFFFFFLAESLFEKTIDTFFFFKWSKCQVVHWAFKGFSRWRTLRSFKTVSRTQYASLQVCLLALIRDFACQFSQDVMKSNSQRASGAAPPSQSANSLRFSTPAACSQLIKDSI